jgi:hypothetical protein
MRVAKSFKDTGEQRKEVYGVVVDFQKMELERVNFKGQIRHDNDS